MFSLIAGPHTRGVYPRARGGGDPGEVSGVSRGDCPKVSVEIHTLSTHSSVEGRPDEIKAALSRLSLQIAGPHGP